MVFLEYSLSYSLLGNNSIMSSLLKYAVCTDAKGWGRNKIHMIHTDPNESAMKRRNFLGALGKGIIAAAVSGAMLSGCGSGDDQPPPPSSSSSPPPTSVT